MGIGLSYEKISEDLKRTGITLLEPYKGYITIRHKVRCGCGKEFKPKLSWIRCGTTRSCGCGWPKKKLTSLSQDEAERRYLEAGLTLLSKYINRVVKVKARCHCGKEFETRSVCVLNGKRKSCGCAYSKASIKKAIEKPVWRGYGEISLSYWGKVKSGAGQRSNVRFIKFNITIQEAWELFLKQERLCALSGREIAFARLYSKDRSKQTASLDRIDPSKDYTVDNVQWVHKSANLAKHYMQNSDFIDLCIEIATKHKEKRK